MTGEGRLKILKFEAWNFSRPPSLAPAPLLLVLKYTNFWRPHGAQYLHPPPLVILNELSFICMIKFTAVLLFHCMMLLGGGIPCPESPSHYPKGWSKIAHFCRCIVSWATKPTAFTKQGFLRVQSNHLRYFRRKMQGKAKVPAVLRNVLKPRAADCQQTLRCSVECAKQSLC